MQKSKDISITKIYTVTFGFKYMSNYCKFWNFREGFIYTKLREKRILAKWRNHSAFTDIGTSCPSPEFKRRKYVF